MRMERTVPSVLVTLSQLRLCHLQPLLSFPRLPVEQGLSLSVDLRKASAGQGCTWLRTELGGEQANCCGTGLKWPKAAPELLQNGSKTAPKWLQNCSRTAPNPLLGWQGRCPGTLSQTFGCDVSLLGRFGFRFWVCVLVHISIRAGSGTGREMLA